MTGASGDAPLAGKVAVVTGAGGGIGRAITLAYIRAGASVVGVGRSADPLAETGRIAHDMGGTITVLSADVRDGEALAAIAKRVEDEHGQVDVLVANSGIGGPMLPLWEVPVDGWDDTIATNLTGVFLTCRAFVPGMITRRRGSIVVIGSITGKRPVATRAAYASSKIGLVGLVRTLALDAGKFGIRANLISPGPVAGARLRGVLDAQVQLTGRSLTELEQDLLAQLALPQLTEAEDVADCAVFLASESSRAISGQDINVAAGMVMY
jgi:NAD(P)-dependent dehydrogenase (short-subunit alcohol dehydrogenase family)